MTGISRALRDAQRPGQGRDKGGRRGAGLRYAAALLVCLSAAPAQAAPQNNGVGSQFELLYWQSVAASDDPGQLEAYLAQYPNGTFASLARAKIAQLTKRPPQQSVPPMQPTIVPPPVAPEPAPVVAPQTVAPPAPVAQQQAQSPLQPLPAPLPAPPPAPPIAPPLGAPQPQPVPVQTPASPPTSVNDSVSIILGNGAMPMPAPMPVPAAPSAVTLPPRPQFQPLPPVNLPARFCTAMERNDFYDAAFRPSKDVADQNNQTAINHMRTLQALYDRLGQGGDMASQNIVAAEARAYQPVAAAAYQSSTAYEGLFNRLMAVPIVPCGAPTP